MGKRKSSRRSEKSETLIPKSDEDDQILQEEEQGEKEVKFFACYLLTSLSPRHKGQTYIGFTVNPRRRIRQHNGEIGSGAWRTKSKRPWEMVLCIYGFPTNVTALQFEWAWQHPVESLAVRKAAVEFKSLRGLANKIKLAYTMLTLPSWQSLNLTVNFFSTKYIMHYAGCPSLPTQMKVHVHSMDELPCYAGDVLDVNGIDPWDDDRVTAGSSGLVEEGLENATTVHVSSDSQNSIKEAASKWARCFDENSVIQPRGSLIQSEEHRQPFSESHNRVNDASLEWTRCADENSATHPMGSPIQNEEHRQPFCSIEEGFSLNGSSSYSGRKDLDMFPSTEECTIELDTPTTQNFLPTAADKDQPPVKSLAKHCPLEVIDVFTPSPNPKYNSLRKKKRAASSVCPQIIDLTQSPIFV